MKTQILGDGVAAMMLASHADELPNHEVAGLFLSQLHAFKYQKARLIEKLEKQNEPKIQIQLEKIISDIDCRISQIVVKLMKDNRRILSSIHIKSRLTNERDEQLSKSHILGD